MRHPLSRVGALVAVLVSTALAARVAWVCDDAYLTFRTVDLWQLGHGPVFNVGERVAAYTHPLWMVLLAGVSLLTGELYYTSVGLGLSCTLATLALLASLSRERATWPLLFVPGMVKATAEYATSGLENSLSALVVAAVLAVLTQDKPTARRRHVAALLLGLMPLVRADLALIGLPVGLWLVSTTGGTLGHRAWLVVLGGGPSLVWHSGALVYYGSVWPNTALAKLGHASLADSVAQGLSYAWSSVVLDRPLVPLLVAGLGTGVVGVRRRPELAALCGGALLYCAYVVVIGGDFMSGRFFSVPAVVALAALLVHGGARSANTLTVGFLVLSLASPRGPLRTPDSFHAPHFDNAGIADERGWYFRHLGVVPMLREQRDPPRPGRQTTARVVVGDAIGLDAYMAGPAVHYIDRYALTDAFLARLPSAERTGRPGHWSRPLPPGYVATLETGDDQLTDPSHRALWRDVSLATRAPLLEPARAGAILRLLRRTSAETTDPMHQ